MCRSLSAVPLAFALAGCAHPMSPERGDEPPASAADLSTPAPSPYEDLGAPADLARGGGDLVHATNDLAQPPVNACHPVINELQTGTAATGTAEFVELYNPCSSVIALTGWKLAYRAATNTNAAGGTDSSTLYSWPSGSLAAGAYRVYTGSGWTGASDGAMTSGLAAPGGAVGLRDASGALVDSVAYGTAAGGFMESAAAPAPPAGSSISRLPDGSDTDANMHDFHVTATPTPGAANH